jgi:ribonuclease-3
LLLAFIPIFSRKTSEADQEIVRFIISKFGYRLKNLEIFREALTHKSLTNISGEASNERLEFLGDAVLDAVIAEMLYEKFPGEDEGTKIKSKIVNRRTLGSIGHDMEIGSILQYNKTRSIKIETIEGNAFEALIGAIYLDGGLESVKKSINRHILRKYVNLNQILVEEIDFKSRLFIWSQKNRLPIEFEVVSEENQGNAWKYVIKVSINGQEYGMGIGSSKKKAEQEAAKETLELIGEL